MTSRLQVTEEQRGRFNQRLVVMKTIHLALVAGVVLFGAIVIGLTRSRMDFGIAFHNPFFIIACLFAATNISIASSLRKLFFRVNAKPSDLESALRKYQVFVLIRAALIEGAALFSAVVTLLTCTILPVFILILCAMVLIIYRPSEKDFLALMHSAPPANFSARG